MGKGVRQGERHLLCEQLVARYGLAQGPGGQGMEDDAERESGPRLPCIGVRTRFCGMRVTAEEFPSCHLEKCYPRLDQLRGE